MLKRLGSAFLLAVVAGPALADTISFTVNVSGGWVEFPESTSVNLAGFNPALGTLTGVTDTIELHGTAGLSNYGPYPGPFTAALTANALLSGPSGLASYAAKPYTIAAGPTQLSAAYALDASYSFAASAAYDASQIDDSFEAGFLVTKAKTGAPITSDDSGLSYSGTFTETFAYTPIPEPTSLAIMLGGVLAMALTGALSRRKPHNAGD